MKVKTVLSVLAGIAAIAALAAGIALFVNRYIFANNDENYIECDCDGDEQE